LINFCVLYTFKMTQYLYFSINHHQTSFQTHHQSITKKECTTHLRKCVYIEDKKEHMRKSLFLTSFAHVWEVWLACFTPLWIEFEKVFVWFFFYVAIMDWREYWEVRGVPWVLEWIELHCLLSSNLICIIYKSTLALHIDLSAVRKFSIFEMLKQHEESNEHYYLLLFEAILNWLWGFDYWVSGYIFDQHKTKPTQFNSNSRMAKKKLLLMKIEASLSIACASLSSLSLRPLKLVIFVCYILKVNSFFFRYCNHGLERQPHMLLLFICRNWTEFPLMLKF
jgi:hypothetical protein